MTCRLVREPREQGTTWFPKLKNEPVLPHLYCITSCLRAHGLFGRFFWRSFPYTQAEATRIFRICGESSPLSLRDRSCVRRISTGFQTACAKPSSCAKRVTER